MDAEITELDEYSLYLEFVEVVNEAVCGSDDDQDECDISDDSDQMFDFEDNDDILNVDHPTDVDEIDEGDIDIMQCIINMIEIQYILQNDFPEERRKAERRWGVHPLNQLRREHGVFHNLFEEMLAHDHDKFFNYTRMTPERFEHLFKLIETRITKKAPNAIPAKCRLLLTLRYRIYFNIDRQLIKLILNCVLQFLGNW